MRSYFGLKLAASVVCATLILGQTMPTPAPSEPLPAPEQPLEPAAPAQEPPLAPCEPGPPGTPCAPAETPQVASPQPIEAPTVRAPVATHDINALPSEPGPGTPIVPMIGPGDDIYTQVNLVADVPATAQRTEERFINPMGLAFGPTVPIRIAMNGTGVVTTYGNAGQPYPSTRQQRIIIPSAKQQRSGKPSGPTGVTLNETPEFVVSSDRRRAPGRFLFATEDGTIAAFSPDVSAHTATLVVDNSLRGFVYTGIAHGVATTGAHLYVANFRAGSIDVFDRRFRPTTVEGGFVDADIPAGYAPYNVQRIGEQLFVTYARQNPDFHGAVAGPGNGFINVFDYLGRRVRRFASNGSLNAPWGMTRAPQQGFGRFSDALLVANHGDGRISAFNYDNGEYLGQLRAPDGNPIQIEGLWGLASRRIVEQSPALALEGKNVVFFTAGPGQQMHGLFGRLEPGIAAAQTVRR